VVLLVATMACASSTDPGDASGGTGGTLGAGGAGGAETDHLSAGCGLAGQETGEMQRRVQVGGVDRTYVLSVPANHDPDVPLPVILVFHGSGGSSRHSMAMGLQEARGADQAIYLFPDGIVFEGYEIFGTSWNLYCNGYDMNFVDEMLSYVESHYCVDENRRFATGFSWGADMTNAIACCKGDEIRAVASASGDAVDWNGRCPGRKRPAFRFTHGANRLDGGDGPYSGADFRASVAFYRRAHGCSDEIAEVEPAPCVEYQRCAEPVIVCTYPDMGHALPFGWASDTWSFFSSFE
jgi:poly(3-hydroxybutyrate) depolymerase